MDAFYKRFKAKYLRALVFEKTIDGIKVVLKKMPWVTLARFLFEGLA